MSSILKFGGCSRGQSILPQFGRVDQNHDDTNRGIEAKSGRAVGNAFAVIENGARVPSLAFIGSDI